MGDLTEHFSRHEFQCPCCGLFNLRGRLLATLETLRAAAGQPVHIESGCRCEKKNAAVGGAEESGHLTGEAADVWVTGWSNARLGALVKSLHAQGRLPHLTYCYLIKGTSGTRIHLGVDVKKRTRIFAF